MLSLAAIIVKEEDTLVLSLAESNLREEQKQIQTRLQHLKPYIWGFGWAFVALLAIIAPIGSIAAYKICSREWQPGQGR